jgi:hypothetical protein
MERVAYMAVTRNAYNIFRRRQEVNTKNDIKERGHGWPGFNFLRINLRDNWQYFFKYKKLVMWHKWSVRFVSLHFDDKWPLSFNHFLFIWVVVKNVLLDKPTILLAVPLRHSRTDKKPLNLEFSS